MNIASLTIRNIKFQRKNRKITQKQMADMMGVSRDTYARIERAKDIKIKYLWQIAQIFKMNVLDLIKEK